jgi:FKBP-type peptidyl-prolyl cis-trans isomerase (trigger factor)
MQITSHKINPYTFQITVKESSVELQKARKHVLNEIRADGKVTGFMKGSEIPEEAIIRQYGEPFITSKAIDQYLEKAYPKILRKADITPVAPGNITEMKSTEPLEFTLEIEVLPEVEIDEKILKTIKVKKTPVSVEEKEIDEEIQAIEKRFTHFHHVGETTHDGAEIQGETANMGDRVTVTAEGYEGKEGESIPETKVPAYPLILGSNAFIP